MLNHRPGVDAAMTLLLHIEDHCRRASERGRYSQA
jgi:hypothetical protein